MDDEEIMIPSVGMCCDSIGNLNYQWMLQMVDYGSSNQLFDSTDSSSNNIEEEEKQLGSQTYNELVPSTKAIAHRPRACSLVKTIPLSQQIKLFADLILTNDGVVRLTGDLNQVSFGFQQGTFARIHDLHTMGIVNIEMSPCLPPQMNTVSESVALLREHNDTVLHQISCGLENQYNKMQILQQFQPKIKSLSDVDLSMFIALCFEYLRDTYNQQNSNGMYVYSIGRIEPNSLKEFETYHTGYSKAYLDFLGIDSSSMRLLFLRQKQIDLIQDPKDISKNTQEFLRDRTNFCINTETQSIIKTFDGFPIKISSKRRQIRLDLRPNDFKFKGHLLQIFEIDVELNDLERLIEYRQNLSNRLPISLEDFLNKELSYYFEDVEYSVQSEEFLEKFYEQNLKDLKAQKENLKIKLKEFKRCSYRVITPPTNTVTSNKHQKQPNY